MLAFLSAINLCSTSFAKEQLVLAKIEGSNLSDISERVLTEAYHKIGIDIVVKTLPARRAILSANNGEVGGELHRVKGINKKYTNLEMVPISINHVEGVVFSKNKEFIVEGWESLRPYKIGIIRGVIYTEKGTTGMQVYPATTNEQLFKMLDMDRLDIGILNRITGLLYIDKLKLNTIKALEPPVEKLPLYHYLHKKHVDLIPKITEVLSVMKKEGRIKQIRKEYIDELQTLLK